MGHRDTRSAKGYYSNAVHKSLIFIKKKYFVRNADNFHREYSVIYSNVEH